MKISSPISCDSLCNKNTFRHFLHPQLCFLYRRPSLPRSPDGRLLSICLSSRISLLFLPLSAPREIQSIFVSPIVARPHFGAPFLRLLLPQLKHTRTQGIRRGSSSQFPRDSRAKFSCTKRSLVQNQHQPLELKLL